MIPVYYDLHIHSALSPCADNDMTPNDIVGMAMLNGLDMIAVTDHNSMANAGSVMKAAEGKGLIVLPGAEIETSEEVHVLCLFGSLKEALSFEADVSPHFSPLQNRTDIYGSQLLLDKNDNVMGELDRMLLASSTISFSDLQIMTMKHGGAFIPAHIDRDSMSVISNLGFLPPDMNIPVVEVSPRGVERGFIENNRRLFPGSRVITSSDAHHLWAIAERTNYLMLPGMTAEAAIKALSL